HTEITYDDSSSEQQEGGQPMYQDDPNRNPNDDDAEPANDNAGTADDTSTDAGYHNPLLEEIRGSQHSGALTNDEWQQFQDSEGGRLTLPPDEFGSGGLSGEERAA